MAKVTNIQIEYINIDKLTPYQKNTRKHGTEDVKKIAKSISKHGMCDPIGVWGEDNIIVEGHGRYAACKSLGIETVPVLRLDEMTDKQRREYAIAHNRTAEFSVWDFDMLKEESKELDFSDFDFDLTDDEDAEWERKRQEFAQRMESGELSEDDEEYQEFLAKFEAKKTTDDCYTPDLVYEAVADYVATKYKRSKANFVRPFYPGGDYQKERYKSTDVVVDNPPFSILAEILDFYNAREIKYFLFAPNLTLICTSAGRCAALCVGVGVTYENGAVVNTSFATNLEDLAFSSAPDLYKAVNNANKEWMKTQKAALPKYSYPLDVVMATQLEQYSKHGILFECKTNEAVAVRQLDSQKESGKTIYGTGFFISNNKKAEREKAEREKVTRWELSDREKAIIKELK